MFNFLTNNKTTFSLLSILLFSFTSTCQSDPLPAFKHFSDYIDIKPTKRSQPSQLRAHFFAKQKFNDRVNDPTYKNNSWKLVMRRGLFLSEVEKAMSEIYAHFLGYSTDIDLVEENGDYYAARRKFRHFKVFEDMENPCVIRKEGEFFYVKNYLLLEDGSLIKDNKIKKFAGLAKIAVLTRFFGESDADTFNYGIQETDTEIRAIHFDNEHAFTFQEDTSNFPDIENDLADMFGKKFIEMAWFQREKQDMLKKIANTNFSIIERIVRKNITVSRLEEARWTLTKILNNVSVFPEYDRKKAQQELDELNTLDESKYDVGQIIKELKTRHQKLRDQLKIRS